jgi:hypothetical protein
MAPDAKTNNLLYVSQGGSSDNTVYVYAYPSGKPEGMLTGFHDPRGLCVDQAGDVWVTNYATNEIIEYAHGGTSPIATLTDESFGFTTGCAVDKKTGNLAATSVGTSFPGDVEIFKQAQGAPTAYSDPAIRSFVFCGYDGNDNLFVDGKTGSGGFQLDKLGKGKTSFTEVTLNQSFNAPGGVQWRSGSLAVGDEAIGVIYQFSIKGTTGTETGNTPLTGSSTVNQFWIQGKTVIGPSFNSSSTLFWSYPAGGVAKKTIASPYPFGSTVSLAK